MPMTERIFKQAYTVGMSNRLVVIFFTQPHGKMLSSTNECDMKVFF